MRTMHEASVDAVVCDPPYGIEFMGREWDKLAGTPGYNERGRITERPDAQEWHAGWAREALRIAKPGAHLVAFGSPRTFHRLTCGLEDAGWEIRDVLMWLYGQGFPKSKNLGGGLGSALKPAWEPIVLARKPPVGSLTANHERYGTGPLNIDATRIEGAKPFREVLSGQENDWDGGGPWKSSGVGAGESLEGRWPANVVLSHLDGCRLVGTRHVPTGTAGPLSGGIGAGTVYRESATNETGIGAPEGYADEDGMETVQAWDCEPGCPVLALDEQAGPRTSSDGAVKRATGADEEGNRGAAYGSESRPAGTPMIGYGDTGSASRFYYTPKATASERSAGLPGRNEHPTVKPIELMRWLIRMVTPVGGQVLDPFLGSGTTGCAAMLEPCVGFFVGIEQDADHALAARMRIGWWAEHPDGMELTRRLELERAAKERRDAGQETLF